jgi:hypothetical protein
VKFFSSFSFLLVSTLAGVTPALAVTCMNNLPASNPDSAYVVHGDGTATDARTGLMWKVCAEGQTWSAGACGGSTTTATWAGALAQAEAAVYAGHSDWRLPNLKELRSLVEECRVSPAINDSIFPGASSSDFWSGSPYASSSSYAWVVYFYYGYAYYFNRNYSNSVRLVRGGQSSAPLPPSNSTLTVVASGSGSISGTGISCGSDCSESYPSGTPVSLTATPSSGATFSGWSGACSGTATTCTVTMDAAKTVGASFTPAPFTVTTISSGPGTITSTPAGITCGSDCSEIYASGTKVTLTATPSTGATFSGWSGACSGKAATCTVTMDAAKTVKAGFVAQNPSDCIFDWAERDFPQYFAPAKASSAYYQNFYYRYYATTGVYLATNDNILWALGPPTGNALLSLGPMSNFLQPAECQ